LDVGVYVSFHNKNRPNPLPRSRFTFHRHDHSLSIQRCCSGFFSSLGGIIIQERLCFGPLRRIFHLLGVENAGGKEHHRNVVVGWRLCAFLMPVLMVSMLEGAPLMYVYGLLETMNNGS